MLLTCLVIVTFRGMTSAMQQQYESNLLWLQRQKQEREFVAIKMSEAQEALARLSAERDCYKQQLGEVRTQLASIRQIKQPEEPLQRLVMREVDKSIAPGKQSSNTSPMPPVTLPFADIVHMFCLHFWCDSYEEKMRQIQELERKLVEQHEQYTRDVNRLSLQAHNMEGALKRERLKASEEKYGTIVCGSKSEGQKNIREQLQECEDALVVKQEHIDMLKNKVSNQQAELESVPVLKAQAEIFKADFLTERQQREQIHSEKERVKEQLELMRQENERLKNELDKMGRENCQLNAPPGSTAASVLTPPTGDLECPICHFGAPDIDTLQIHVQDCIQ
uniref:CCHC NOA-type domain-containing protein n=1 Tax=Eptatretus burgeri TaxID=7764 RepID=A0A8C4QMJ0_EPTBU